MFSVRVAFFAVLQGVVLTLDPTSCTSNKLTSGSTCTNALWTCACMSTSAVCGSYGNFVNNLVDCSTGIPGFTCGSGYTPTCNCVGAGCTVQVDPQGSKIASAACTLQPNSRWLLAADNLIAPNDALGIIQSGNIYGLAAFTWSSAQNSSSTNPWTTTFTITQSGATSTLSTIKMETGTQKCTQSRLIIMPSGSYSMVRYLITCGLSSGTCTGRVWINMVAYFAAVDRPITYTNFAGCSSCPSAAIYTDGTSIYCSTSCGPLDHFYLPSSSSPVFTDRIARPFTYEIQRNNITSYPRGLIAGCAPAIQVGQKYCACINLSNECISSTGTTSSGLICPSPFTSVCYSTTPATSPPFSGDTPRDLSGRWTRLIDTCSTNPDCFSCRSTLSTIQSADNFIALASGASCSASCSLRITGNINNDRINGTDGTTATYSGTADSSNIALNIVNGGSTCDMRFSYTKSTASGSHANAGIYTVAMGCIVLAQIML